MTGADRAGDCAGGGGIGGEGTGTACGEGGGGNGGGGGGAGASVGAGFGGSNDGRSGVGTSAGDGAGVVAGVRARCTSPGAVANSIVTAVSSIGGAAGGCSVSSSPTSTAACNPAEISPVRRRSWFIGQVERSRRAQRTRGREAGGGGAGLDAAAGGPGAAGAVDGPACSASNATLVKPPCVMVAITSMMRP